jgi:hypothetical protein
MKNPKTRRPLPRWRAARRGPVAEAEQSFKDNAVASFLPSSLMAAYHDRRAYSGFKKSFNALASPSTAAPTSGAVRNPGLAAVLSLTEGRSASAEGLSEADHQMILSEMGDAVRLDKNTYIYQSNNNPTDDYQGQATGETTTRGQLRDRAGSLFARSEEALERLRHDNDGAEALFGVPEADQTREALIAQLVAVATGRKQLFHDTFTPEAGLGAP